MLSGATIAAFADELTKIALINPKTGPVKKVRSPTRKEDREPFYNPPNHEVNSYGSWGMDYANQGGYQ